MVECAEAMSHQKTGWRRAIKSYVVGQFGRPHGLADRLAGLVMARRASNRQRNRWTVDLMEIQPDHRVLEIGYGPGVALADVCRRLGGGRAVGLDHSATMLRAARRRNRQALQSGKLELHVGSLGDLDVVGHSALAGPFDRIFAVNVLMFSDDPVADLSALADRLGPAGKIYVTFQPRGDIQTDAAALAAAETMTRHMRSAGLADVTTETMTDLDPMAVCVIGSGPVVAT